MLFGKTLYGIHEARFMGGQIPAGLGQVKSRQDKFHAAATVEKKQDSGTLILDRLARILSCGVPAERIFGASQGRLIGKPISDFVSGLPLGGSSPSYNTRYLVDLCAEGEWRKYEARDAAGRAFAVELKLTRMATASSKNEMFLLHVRLPDANTAH